MTPECLAMLLKGRVARASRCGEDHISFAINRTVHALLDGVKDNREDRRLSYSSTLCEDVACSMEPWRIFKLLETETEVSSSQFILSQHLVAGATAIGDINRVQLLLSKGLNEQVKCAFFGDSLRIAARRGREDILKLLIRHYVNASSDVNAPEAISQAFTAACASGHASIVNFLLHASKGNAMMTFNYEEAIIAAARNGHVALVQTFLQRGLLPDNRAIVISEAAFAASSRGHRLVVQMLLNHSLDVNVIGPRGKSLLHDAARGGHSRVVQLLLDHGVSYDDDRGYGPLHLAALNGHEDVVQLLLDYGADINAYDPYSFYCTVARAAWKGESSMIRFLVERGLDIHAGNRGVRALVRAVEGGHEETVRLLVGMGADVDGCYGAPMRMAMEYGQQCVVDTLLELGAKKIDDPSRLNSE